MPSSMQRHLSSFRELSALERSNITIWRACPLPGGRRQCKSGGVCSAKTGPASGTGGGLSLAPMLDVDFGVEAGRLAVAARHRHEVRVVIPEHLKHRFGRPPQRHVAVQRAVVMGGHEDIGLVEAGML